MERILNAIVILFIIGLISTISIMIHKHESDKDLRYKYKIFIRHHGVFRTNSYQRERKIAYLLLMRTEEKQ